MKLDKNYFDKSYKLCLKTSTKQELKDEIIHQEEQIQKCKDSGWYSSGEYDNEITIRKEIIKYCEKLLEEEK